MFLTQRPLAPATIGTFAAAQTHEETDGPAFLSTRSTADVARLCTHESARYQRGEPVAGVYGFELFRRAIVERDEAAWTALTAQYTPLVRQWLRRWPDSEGVEAGIAATFARFWQAVTVAKFSRFTSLAAVLRYLKLCTQSSHLDQARAARLHGRVEPLDKTAHHLAAPDDPTEQLVRAQDARTLWCAVRQNLRDEREQAVIYLSFVHDLSPRQIYAGYGAHFSTVADVYRLKRTALDRLRRAPALSILW